MKSDDFVTRNEGLGTTPPGSLLEARDLNEAARRLRLILAHANHEATPHCLAEIMLHARIALGLLTEDAEATLARLDVQP